MSAKVPSVRPRDTRRNGPQYAGASPMQPPRKWTPEEDELLRQAVHEIGARHWKIVAERVPGRNHVQCLQRYLRVLQPGLKKGHWTPEEDEKLRSLATKGFTSWIEAAEQIPGRSAKQCRDRWRNHLEGSIKHGAWEPEEDALLLELHSKHGNRWAAIARCIPGRTENAVKIHCKSLLARRNGTSEHSHQSDGGFDLNGEEDSEQGTEANGQYTGKSGHTDSEDDPEATTDDLSSISPLPSPMGYPGQWMQPWGASPTNASGNRGGQFALSSGHFPSGQHTSSAVLRAGRLQSFPPPIMTSNLLMRRSSFPAVQGVPAQGASQHQMSQSNSSHSRQHLFAPLDTSAATMTSDPTLLADSASSSPVQSPTHSTYTGTNTFNGAIPLSYRLDMPAINRPSAEVVGERYVVPPSEH